MSNEPFAAWGLIIFTIAMIYYLAYKPGSGE